MDEELRHKKSPANNVPVMVRDNYIRAEYADGAINSQTGVVSEFQ